MGAYIELISNFIQMFVLTYFVRKSLTEKNSSIFSKVIFVSTWLLCFVELSIINYVVVFDGFWSVIIVITLLCYARICLKGKFLLQIFVIFFAMSIIYSIASTVLFLFSYVIGDSIAMLIMSRTLVRVAILVICRSIECIIFRFIQKINSEYSLDFKEWVLFTGMPFLTWIAITYMMDTSMDMKNIDSGMFSIALILLSINVITFFFLYRIRRDSETKHEYELLKMQHSNMKEMENNMRALYESTYSVKHDLEKHFLAIKIMAERNEYHDIEKYVDGIVENDLRRVKNVIFTDNDIFNAVINTKLELCRQKGIFTSVNISDDAIKCIDAAHITVLFGNIIDNAIEAAEKSDEKFINISVRLQGEYVSIYIENSFNTEYSNVNLSTSKKDKNLHGYGIKNVKRIVDECNGMIQHFVKDEMFCCDILLRK